MCKPLFFALFLALVITSSAQAPTASTVLQAPVITPDLLAQNARLRANADALPVPELSLTPMIAIATTLKGHALGEPLTQFIQESGEETRSLFVACLGQSDTSIPESPKNATHFWMWRWQG